MPVVGPVAPVSQEEAMAPETFEQRLRAMGAGYHIHHPFNVRLNSGQCSRRQVQGWIANRFYYQWCIPLKDAAILSNCPDRAVRRAWSLRLLDHDGHGDFEGDAAGGLEAWTQLGVAADLTREDLWSLRLVQPGVRFACDSYVNFARHAPWQEAVCSSLTEMFAPQIHKDRLAGWPEYYPWIEPYGLQYFRSRIPLAQRDVRHGLEITLKHFRTRAQQERALQILQFKLDILWAMLDAIERAYPE
ncbi:pyrroloquinoline quinone biosynthesis protein PqqC [Lampropedia cohaerens]|uniref:Pyrroloquinoline-quinone synthase n=1 Tax=Lampropedia cohaerens TaxID=1610491 RepID=A0A0U1PY26_9BURK|nr:pyrroloquinoline-quinone synthase PqqC [Lampropedia cohaerens]KKW67422.1 pyrroloquinoline quinone biosynthesis protein PqqC [Lampropedia cohaerens]